MSAILKPALRGPLVPLAIATVALTAIGATQLSGPDRKEAADPEPVAMVHATQLTSAVTLEDWAAAADYVVTARVAGEQRLAPAKSETSGFADNPIGRLIEVDVQEVHWKAEDAVSALPETLTMDAWGWLPRSGGEVEMVGESSTRLEVGRTYLMAVAWKRAECGDGETIPESWVVIGAGGAIPADGGVLGDGEFEGIDVAPESKRLDAPGPSSVTARFAGKRADDVVRGFKGLTPKRNHAFRQIGGSCS